MKKLLFCLALTPLTLPMAPLHAQTDLPKNAPTEGATTEANPAAVALLDQSAAAYKELKGLSMRFSWFDTKGEETKTGDGTIEFERPARARITLAKNPKQPFTTDSASAKTVEEAGQMLQSAMMAIPSGVSVPLAFLVNGENPLRGGAVFGRVLTWTNVKTLPENGVSMTTAFSPGQPIVFNLYFDPTDHLLRRVEAKIMVAGQPMTNISTLTNLQTNPTFAPETFVKPPAPPEPAERLYFDPKLKRGVVPYALTGADLSGKPLSLASYKGKVVLLDFWATWCGPCVGELPNVLSNYKKYHATGFEIIGISLDQSKKDLTDFIKTRQMPWPQLFDGKVWKNVNSTRYGVRAIPFTLLIGKDGKIAAVNPRGPELEPALKAALAN